MTTISPNEKYYPDVGVSLRTGPDAADRTGLDRTGPDWTGLDRTGPDAADRTGPDAADRTGQMPQRAGLERADAGQMPYWAGPDRADAAAAATRAS